MTTDLEDGHRDKNWNPEDQDMGASRLGAESSNGAADDHQNPDMAGDYQRGGEPPNAVSGSKGDPVYREKQLKVLRSFSVFRLSARCTRKYVMTQ
jgi:hypothetical protein